MAVPTLLANSNGTTTVNGSIAWGAFTIRYGGVSYGVGASSTTKKFTYWLFNAGAPVLNAADILPDLGPDDLLLFLNKNGTPVNAQAASVLDGSLIVPESILTDALSANSVTGEKILAGEINASHILANSITGEQIAANSITANEIASNYVYTGEVNAGQINTGAISAALALVGSLDVGENISIDPTNGIVITTPTGMITFPADGQDANISANVTAKSLTVLGQLAIRGITNEVSKGAGIALATGTTAPASAPQATTGWPSKSIHEGYTPRGFAQYGTGFFATESVGVGVVQRSVETSTSFDFTLPQIQLDIRDEITSAMGGIAFIGNRAYILCTTTETVPGSYVGAWYVYVYQDPGDGTSWTYITNWKYQPTTTLGANSQKDPTIGVKGSNLLIAQCDTSGVFHAQEFTVAGARATDVILKNDNGTNWVANRHARACLYGTFDYSTPKYVVALDQQGYAYPFEGSTGVSVSSLQFPVPSTDLRGMLWDSVGGRFRCRDGTKVYDHTPFVDDSLPLWVGTTWRNVGATAPAYADAETQVSPLVKVTARKRTTLFVSTAPIPDDGGDPNDAEAISVYVGHKSTAPANGELYRQATPALGVNSVQIANPVFSGGNPPTVNSFSSTSPAYIASSKTDVDGALITLRGDGSGRIGQLNVDTNGVVTMKRPRAYAHLSGNAAVVTGAWKVLGEASTGVGTLVVDEIDDVTYSNGAFTINTTGRYAISMGASYAPGGTGTRGLRWIVNGAESWNIHMTPTAYQTGGDIGREIPLVAGDVIKFTAWQNSGANLNILGDVNGLYTWVAIRRIQF